MKTFILRPKDKLEKSDVNPWEPWFDKAFGFVINAENEKEARSIAQSNGGAETRNNCKAWSEKYSTCVELGTITDKGVIMEDFAKA